MSGHTTFSAGAATIDTLPAEVRQSLAHCHMITRTQARNFYYGLKLTPEPKRSALYAVYAFMRACDDLVDEAQDQDPAAALQRIEQFRSDMQRVLDGGALPAGPIWMAFQWVVHQYPIDPAHLHAMLDGQRCDLERTRYETFDQLYDYCYKVASVVGLVCIAVWGCDGSEQTRKMAEHRGIAFQLTNILRDVAEDAQRGRIYLPSQELEKFGYLPDDLLALRANDAFDAMMRFQIDRARDYYERSASLEQHLDPACRATSWAMMRIYRGLLDRIAANPRRVLQQRVRLSRLAKMSIALQASWRQRRAG